MDQDATLAEAEVEGYSMLGHLRPGDRFHDKLVRRLDGTKGGWLTVDRLASDRSERRLGPTHPDCTCWVHATDEDGHAHTLTRPVYNLFLAELHNPESIAAMQERHAPAW